MDPGSICVAAQENHGIVGKSTFEIQADNDDLGLTCRILGFDCFRNKNYSSLISENIKLIKNLVLS